MGTNYYIRCKHCGTNTIHLGKHSAINKWSSNYENEEEMMKILKTKLIIEDDVIVDEYGEEYGKYEFLKKIDILNCKWFIVGGEFS